MRTGTFLLLEDGPATLGCVYVEKRGDRGYLGLLSIDPELQKVVNETKRNNACLDEHGRGVAKACSQEVESWFSVRPRRRTLHAGRYLGIKTEVISWLIGPYTEDTLPELS
jgi:hypothetical protein